MKLILSNKEMSKKVLRMIHKENQIMLRESKKMSKNINRIQKNINKKLIIIYTLTF